MLRRDPSRRHHRSPASASSRRGRIPDKQLPQDDDTTAPFAAECQSFLRASWMPGLITVWLPVRVLSAPTMQFCANPEFPVSAEYPRSITVWLPVRVLPAPPRSPALNEISCCPPNTRDFARAHNRAVVSS